MPTTSVLVATKPGRMLTNLEGLKAIPNMLLSPLVTWSCEIL